VSSILVVSSESDLREIWRGELEKRGYAAIPAETSVAGVERLREGGFDVVVLDQVVAGGVKSFLDAMHALPDPPPFVLISSAVDAPSLSARLGAAEFLPKPPSLEELVGVVSRLSAGRPAPQTIEDSPTRPMERTERTLFAPLPRSASSSRRR
jgi:DNA-binding NtrC family response regulator